MSDIHEPKNHLGLVVPRGFLPHASKALVHLKGDFVDLTLFEGCESILTKKFANWHVLIPRARCCNGRGLPLCKDSLSSF